MKQNSFIYRKGKAGMKRTYTNPCLILITLGEDEDIILTSGLTAQDAGPGGSIDDSELI